MKRRRRNGPKSTAGRFVNKLPALTAAFWLMKISATTRGETGGDWLSMTMNMG